VVRSTPWDAAGTSGVRIVVGGGRSVAHNRGC